MTNLTTLGFEEFNGILAAADSRRQRRLTDLQRFLDSGRIFLFGYGGKGRSLARHIVTNSSTEVVVFDSSADTRKRAESEGFVVVEDLREAKESRSGVILGACQAQAEQSALIGGDGIYFEEAAYLFDAPHVANKARDFPAWINTNRRSLYEIYRAVHDLSKANFVSVLAFRLSLDPADLAACRRDNKNMWFDLLEARGRSKYPSFLDVGAYDGDTLLAASQRLGSRRGVAVEANTSLFPAINRVAEVYPAGIEIVPCAAWSHPCRLQFSEVRGGMISVSEAADGELAAGPLGDYVHEPVELIKMDIEGSELKALMGCLRILQSGPDLAIAGYHRPEDFSLLPTFLAGAGYMGSNCEFHVVHYSDCLDDTIFYFLRNDGR
jgi:FkbM family methyltransferase